MPGFPAEILPNPAYPVILPGIDIVSGFFIRETKNDIYALLSEEIIAADIIQKIIEPQPSLHEIFELSLFLFGYYSEACFGIRVDDLELNKDWDGNSFLQADAISFSKKEVFPLFLYANRLYEKPVLFLGENYVVSFSHKPTRANYWHFQLFTQDAHGGHISKDYHNSRTRKLAKHLFENFILKAICCNREEVTPFQFSLNQNAQTAPWKHG
jgi:hypothetical protein